MNLADFSGQFASVTKADSASSSGDVLLVIDDDGWMQFGIRDLTILSKTAGTPDTLTVLNGSSSADAEFSDTGFLSTLENIRITSTVNFPDMPSIPGMTITVTPEFIETTPMAMFGGAAGSYTCNATELVMVPLDENTIPSFWTRLPPE